ncbi:MAG: ABC transporter permease [Propionibacteriaceae bacterium]|jgi:oligopeptide transport system permease protein|nr:ABC transporter permease [Propionibacteriaceae bacterium]
MGWYIGKRVLQMVPVFIGATLLVYAMVFLVPGDPIQAMFGERAVNPNVAAQIRQQYHLDQPFINQYLIWLGGIFQGDFGTSFSGRPVIDEIAQVYPTTVRLALMALVLEAVLGVVLGAVAGLRRGRWFDSTALVLSLLLIAVPTFVMGFLLQAVVGVKLKWLPVTVGADVSLRSLLMPAFVLASVSIAYVLRLTRTSVAENAQADFVRTARAKGLGAGQVVRRHILRNSLIPVVTFLGVDLGALMGGAIVTEGIFNIPGVGNKLFQAIIRGQGPTVVSLVTILVLVFMLTSLIVDLLYAALDPRIRLV